MKFLNENGLQKLFTLLKNTFGSKEAVEAVKAEARLFRAVAKITYKGREVYLIHSALRPTAEVPQDLWPRSYVDILITDQGFFFFTNIEQLEGDTYHWTVDLGQCLLSVPAGLNFTEGEVDTGLKWHDGKTIYRRIYKQASVGNWSNTANDGTYTVQGGPFTSSNPAFIVDHELYIQLSGYTDYNLVGSPVTLNAVLTEKVLHTLRKDGNIYVKNKTGASISNAASNMIYLDGWVEYTKV